MLEIAIEIDVQLFDPVLNRNRLQKLLLETVHTIKHILTITDKIVTDKSSSL